MIRVKFDRNSVMSKPSARRSATPYLRGTIGQAHDPRFANLVGRRVIVWQDTDEIEPLEGKTVDLVADLRDEIEVEASGQRTYVLSNIATQKVLTDDEALEFQADMMAAQLENLSTRGVRAITRVAGASTAENVADAALPEGGTTVLDATATEAAPI